MIQKHLFGIFHRTGCTIMVEYEKGVLERLRSSQVRIRRAFNFNTHDPDSTHVNSQATLKKNDIHTMENNATSF